MKYRIKEHRQARGWTQEQLAEMANASKGYISLLESGRRDPSAETLRSLAAAFGVDVTALIEPSTDAARSIIDHLAIFQSLSEADQAVVARIALSMAPKDETGSQ